MGLREVNLAEFLSTTFEVSECEQGFPVSCFVLSYIVFHMYGLTYEKHR